MPKLFDAHPDICYYKTCMFSPHVLAAAGVPVYRAVHEAGSFMITTPGKLVRVRRVRVRVRAPS